MISKRCGIVLLNSTEEIKMKAEENSLDEMPINMKGLKNCTLQLFWEAANGIDRKDVNYDAVYKMGNLAIGAQFAELAYNRSRTKS